MRTVLLSLPKETLVDALLSLANEHSRAADLLERLVASPKENLDRFEQKLAALSCQGRFYDWHSASSFASELADILNDLRAAQLRPEDGVRQVVALYEYDREIFNSVDDSCGDISFFFHHGACELFCDFASRCKDKVALIEIVLTLNEKDDYGVRDTLIEAAERYLPRDDIRNMASHCIERATQAKDEFRQRHWWGIVEALAATLKDAPLFERARLNHWPEIAPQSYLDIARAYLEAEDPRTALTWLNKLPTNQPNFRDEHDDLLLTIHRQLGNQPQVEDVAWRKFRCYRSKSNLKILLDVIGHDKRQEVLTQTVSEILQDEAYRDECADFLFAVGRPDDAASYFMNRMDRLDCEYCSNLSDHAAPLERAGHYLVATLLYRKTITAILQRKMTKDYPQAARHLRRITAIASKVSDWRGLPDHATFFEGIKVEHRRKTSFWRHLDR